MRVLKSLCFASVFAAFVCAPAFSADTAQPAQQTQSPQSMKASLSEAIATAEKQVGGTAVSAKLEHESGKAMYEVHVLKDAKLTSVHVSVDDGKVLSTHEMMAHHKGQMHHQETQHQTDEKS